MQLGEFSFLCGVASMGWFLNVHKEVLPGGQSGCQCVWPGPLRLPSPGGPRTLCVPLTDGGRSQSPQAGGAESSRDGAILGGAGAKGGEDSRGTLPCPDQALSSQVGAASPPSPAPPESP